MATYRVTSAYNGYIPQATGLVVAFVRKESEFPLNRYVQYIPTPTKVGAWVDVERDQQVREYTDESTAWEDGASRKQMGQDNKVSTKYVEFRTQRRNRAWTLGYEAIDQTKDFKLKPLHIDATISQMMIGRTRRIVSLMETASNWASTNTGTANSLNAGAGKWSKASDNPDKPEYNAIFKSLLSVAQVIHLQTNGKVKQQDLRIVLSPGAAILVAASAEITNYCRESPYSKDILQNGLDPQFSKWGLPERYKGWEFIVEDTMRVAEQKKADGSQASTPRGYIMSDVNAKIISRKGGLDGEYGTQSYSTISMYHYGPLMKVAAFDEPEDELVRGHVSEDTKEICTSNVTGYLLTGIV